MEWAHELVNGYDAGDARAKALVQKTRTIVVPVVNPDGFNYSRGGVGTIAEGLRKNCRGGTCGAADDGVDLNRNYGDLWGGEGGSPDPANGNYRGPSPFSEPEAQDIRELISSHQVVVMITNHTLGRVILRQPGLDSEPFTPDEPLYRSLGDSFAAANGYTNEYSYQYYNHVGTSDGWLYYATGGLGYVLESMAEYHPAYSQVVTEYEGVKVGRGDREAFYRAGEAAMNADDHAVLSGSAPPGAVLHLTKSFDNRTTVGPPTHESLDSAIEIPPSGRFQWHVNPSGRPLFPEEQWTLRCEQPEGTVRSKGPVSVVRGQSLDLGAIACGPA
jgi:hypothetical protein